MDFSTTGIVVEVVYVQSNIIRQVIRSTCGQNQVEIKNISNLLVPESFGGIFLGKVLVCIFRLAT